MIYEKNELATLLNALQHEVLELLNGTIDNTVPACLTLKNLCLFDDFNEAYVGDVYCDIKDVESLLAAIKTVTFYERMLHKLTLTHSQQKQSYVIELMNVYSRSSDLIPLKKMLKNMGVNKWSLACLDDHGDFADFINWYHRY